MVFVAVPCPICKKKLVVKYGKSSNGKQRYLCHNETCECKTFITKYTNTGYLPKIKIQIIDMTLNGSGIRDTARVLGISTNTVLTEIKKRNLRYKKSISTSLKK